MNAAPASNPSSMSSADMAAFLNQNAILPLDLITIRGFGTVREKATYSVDMPKPQLRDRVKLTEKQSDGETIESNYDRVTQAGIPIHDSGHPIAEGRLMLSDLRGFLSPYELALYVQTDEGGGNKPKKVEIYRHKTGPDQPGEIDPRDLQRTLESAPDDMSAAFNLWVNPDGNGWLKLNLVLRDWRPLAEGESAVGLGLQTKHGIQTFAAEKFGIRFGGQ